MYLCVNDYVNKSNIVFVINNQTHVLINKQKVGGNKGDKKNMMEKNENSYRF